MGTNEHLIHALRAATLRFDSAISAFASEQQFGMTDVRALIALLDFERAAIPATPGLLSERLRLSSAACTALIDRLESTGHVERSPDVRDRRRVLLTTTAHAKVIGEQFFGDILGPIRAQAATLTAAEADVVLRFLTSVPDLDVSP